MLVVTGLARSGTSLMMQILKANGLGIVTDGRRKADEHNPKGYFEIENIGKKLEEDPNRYNDKKGCVKVLSLFITDLKKSSKKHTYIFMERELGEIFASMEKMSGEPMWKELREHFIKYLEFTKELLEDEHAVCINYNNLIENPEEELEHLKKVIPEMDIEKSKEVIDRELYRNKEVKE